MLGTIIHLQELTTLIGRFLLKQTMEGIYTTSVSTATLDEAPMAYKSLEDIIDVIEESVDVIEVLKPIFNYKAG